MYRGSGESPKVQQSGPRQVVRLGGLQPGLKGRTERVIDDSLLTRHVGGKGVFATPAMILLMENTAHGSVAPHLGPDQTTVGYEVCVKHLGPSQPGATVVVSLAGDVEVEEAAEYLYQHGIPAYAYSTEIPVAVLGAKFSWARGAGLIPPV